MSDYNVIRDVSLTLKKLLQDRLGTPAQPVQVTVDSPHKDDLPEPRVNLYLYLIDQEGERRNTGDWLRVKNEQDGKATVVAEPLALRLFYLLTAFAEDGLSEHRLLGEAMQTMLNNQIIDPADYQGGLATSDVRARSLQLVLLNMDLEQINAIWGNNVALLRASVAYEVSVVMLEPGPPREVPTVLQDDKDDPKLHIEVQVVPYLHSVVPDQAAPQTQIRLFGANLSSPDLRVVFEGPTPDVRKVVTPTIDAQGKVRVTIPEYPHVHQNRRIRIRVELESFRSASVPFDVLEAP